MFDCLEFVVEEGEENNRADKFLSEKIQHLTRSGIAKIFEQGDVTSNEKIIKKNALLKVGDKLTVKCKMNVELELEAQNIPLDIVYEDQDLLVVNKQKGMVVHPAPGHLEETLVNALLFHCGDSLSGINGVMRPGIVHRIDKDTSGLLIVAKNGSAHLSLAEQIKEHSFTRAYEAVVYGNVKVDNGTVDQPIGRNPVDRKKMAVTSKNSKNAVTHYTVLSRYQGFTHIRCELETGRTHQIRVHMAFLGHPIAGDPIYGPKKTISKLNGQCLHAKKIGFVHPRTGEYLEFESELPEYFTKFLKKL